jgi:RNA polymerase sigma-70 factor (sigma-E family)
VGPPGGGADFEEFATAHVTLLLRYATALTCDPHLAQDVVQETLLRAQQRWDRVGSADVPLAYVKRMVTNEYLSWRRRRAAREVALSHADLAAVGPATADFSSGYDERDAMLRRIAALPRRQRTAIVLRYYEHQSDEQIAATMNCTIGTARSHVSRGVAALRAAAANTPGALVQREGT